MEAMFITKMVTNTPMLLPISRHLFSAASVAIASKVAMSPSLHSSKAPTTSPMTRPKLER